jgi:hypothetical protein
LSQILLDCMGFSHAPVSVSVSDVLRLLSELSARTQAFSAPPSQRAAQPPPGLGGVALDSLHPQDAENLIVLSNWESAAPSGENPWCQMRTMQYRCVMICGACFPSSLIGGAVASSPSSSLPWERLEQLLCTHPVSAAALLKKLQVGPRRTYYYHAQLTS